MKTNCPANTAVSKIPGLKVKSFGSWEPEEFDGPLGKGKIIGPVGYYASWNSDSDSAEENDEKEEAKEAARSNEDAEGMETANQ